VLKPEVLKNQQVLMDYDSGTNEQKYTSYRRSFHQNVEWCKTTRRGYLFTSYIRNFLQIGMAAMFISERYCWRRRPYYLVSRRIAVNGVVFEQVRLFAPLRFREASALQRAREAKDNRARTM